MKINDLEKQTGLKRSNIFYYEREGLISPARKDNNYREYSGEDLSRLKTIIVLRKLGFTVAEIKDLLDGERALADVLPENVARLEAQAAELEAARRMCRDMERQSLTMERFDADEWLGTIEEQERSGQRFMDILGDAADSATGAMAFLQKDSLFQSQGYADYFLSEEGIREHRLLKRYWIFIVVFGLLHLLINRNNGLLIALLYLAGGIVGTVVMALCGRYVIPGREPRRALALTIALLLAADLCLLVVFLWAGGCFSH